MFKDYYSILAISPGSSQTEIIRAFKKLAKKWHPDINKSQDATSRMQEIIEAYQILSSTEKRERYDREYWRYNSYKRAQQENFDEKTYSFEDSELNNWMNEAASQSRQNFKKVFDDINDLAIAGFVGSWIMIKKALKISAILILSIIVLSFVYLVVELVIAEFDHAKYRIINSLPTFTANDNFTNHKIPCIGSFSLPNTLERKTESVDDLNYLESPGFIGLNPGLEILYKVTYQQKGLNQKEPEALLKYARVLLRSERILNNSFPFNLDGSKIKSYDLNNYSENFYEGMEEALTPYGHKILHKTNFEAIKVNNLYGLSAGYIRQLNDNPKVLVEVYYFRKADILYTITFSHRESESGSWQLDFMKFLNSLELEHPLKMPCLNILNQKATANLEFIKIDTLHNLTGYASFENSLDYTISEFGQLRLPSKLSHRRMLSPGPEVFIDLFVDNSIENSTNQALTSYAKVMFTTQKGKKGMTSENSLSLNISNSELQELCNDLRNQYIGHGREISNWSDCKGISVNNIMALKIKYLSRVGDYPSVLFEEYHIENYDRRHIISFSCPVQDTLIWKNEFSKILDSVVLTE